MVKWQQRAGLLGTAAGLAILAVASPAWAQDAPAPTPSQPPVAAAAPGDGLDDIIVTATKRSERLQDVPISVTAVTRDVLDRQNVRELGDITKLVPGLTINYGSQPGNFSINMRGIGTFSNGIAVESDVAVVIDDVPLGFQAAAFKDLIDVERVEALRGPQSTLFGKSAIAGVLNITTQAPTERLTARVMGLVTNDNEWRIGGTVSGPISDTLLFRLTASKTSYDGPVRNLTTGGHLNGSGGFTLTGKLQWKPTDNIEIQFQPRYNSNDVVCCVSPITSLSSSTGAPLYYQGISVLPQSVVLKDIVIGPFNRTVRNDVRAGGKSTSIGGTARLAYTFSPDSFLGEATIASITSVDHWKMIDFQDIDATDSPFLLYFPTNAPSGLNQGTELHGYFHANSVTQELRLTSPGGRPFRYVAGLWYARNYLDRFLDRGPVQNIAKYLAISTNANYAAFAEASLDLGDAVTLVGGLRLNRQKISYQFFKYTTNEIFSQRNSDNAVTGKAGIQFHLTPDIMTYATYSTGYKGQAYDLVSTFTAAIAANMPVPPETAKNYEIGFKSSLFNRRVFFNLALYSADYFGFQTSITTVNPSGLFLTYLNSIGHLRSRGIEADILARVTPHLRFNAAAAYTDATVIDFPNGPCYAGQTLAQGCVTINTIKTQDLAGRSLNNAPKFKFNIGGQYDIPAAQLPVKPFVTINYRWQSDILYALSQDPLSIQKAYGILDGSIGVTSKDDRFKLTLFVNNLLNKHYAQGLGNTASGFTGIPAAATVVTGTTWTPARDSFRYVGARVDMNF